MLQGTVGQAVDKRRKKREKNKRVRSLRRDANHRALPLRPPRARSAPRASVSACAPQPARSKGKPWWHGPLPAAPSPPHTHTHTLPCRSDHRPPQPGNHVRFHGPRRYSLSFSSHGRAWAPLSSGRSPHPARGLERSLLK